MILHENFINIFLDKFKFVPITNRCQIVVQPLKEWTKGLVNLKYYKNYISIFFTSTK